MIDSATTMARRATGLVMLGVFLLPATLWAAPNREVERANALYRDGNFQGALEVYDQLAKEQPENPALQFNRGAAHFQLGDLEKAREAFEQAGVLSEDARLQAQSAYNLGNCAFREGQEKVAQDPDGAMASLNESMTYYKDALSRDKSIEAAAHNLEMAKKTIQELRRQKQQQEQQQQAEKQKKEQEKEENKEALDQLINEQQQQNQQTEQAAQQQQRQQSDPSQPAPTPEQMEAMKQQQSQTRDKTEKLADKMPPQDSPSPEADAKSSAEAAAEKQKEAEEHLQNQDAEAASQAQKEALEKLQEARKAMEEAQENQEKPQQGEQSPKAEGEKQQTPSKPEDSAQKPDGETAPQESGADEAQEGAPLPQDATAKDILNQEKRNKEQRNVQRMIGIAPVEKDW